MDRCPKDGPTAKNLALPIPQKNWKTFWHSPPPHLGHRRVETAGRFGGVKNDVKSIIIVNVKSIITGVLSIFLYKVAYRGSNF